MGKILMVVNADDFGYCEARDRGILDCVRNGIVQNISVILNGKSFDNEQTPSVLTELQKTHPLAIGLHLNLTEGFPVHNNVPSLVGPLGEMKGKLGFREGLANNEISQTDIVNEVLSQIELFTRLFASQPRFHFDSHQHIHIIPSIAPIISELMYKHDFRSTRIPNFKGELSTLSPFLQTVLTQTNQTKEYYSKFISSTTFIGLDLMGNGSLDIAAQVINSEIEKNSEFPFLTIEWMCHPGFRSSGFDDFTAMEEREWEMNLLLSEEMSSFLHKNHIQCTTWYNL